MATKTLTIINIPKKEIGRTLADQLSYQIIGKAHYDRIVQYDVDLIIREFSKNT